MVFLLWFRRYAVLVTFTEFPQGRHIWWIVQCLELFQKVTLGTLGFGALNLHTIIRAPPLISNILQLNKLR